MLNLNLNLSRNRSIGRASLGWVFGSEGAFLFALADNDPEIIRYGFAEVVDRSWDVCEDGS